MESILVITVFLDGTLKENVFQLIHLLEANSGYFLLIFTGYRILFNFIARTIQICWEGGGAGFLVLWKR